MIAAAAAGACSSAAAASLEGAGASNQRGSASKTLSLSLFYGLSVTELRVSTLQSKIGRECVKSPC